MPLTTLSFNEGAACAEETEFHANIIIGINFKSHVLPTVINSAAGTGRQHFIL